MPASFCRRCRSRRQSPHRSVKTTISKFDNGVTLVGRRGWGPGALFGGIIAGALIATAIREGRADDRDMRRCDRDFRGFDPRSGTYIDRYGDERICPYLR